MFDTLKDHYSGKRALITGGAGFIGSNLARALLQLDCKVTVVDNMVGTHGGNLANLDGIFGNVTLNISDVRDTHSFHYLLKDVDIVFNLAGQTSHMDSMTDPVTDLRINTEAQISILESCRSCNPEVRIVFASTRQIYGRAERLPATELDRLEPVDANGINKMAGEWYHVLYQRVYGLKATSLRLTNTYGPRMRIKDARQTFLGAWIKAVLSGQSFEVWGGEQLRDYNYVDDVIHAFLLCGASEAAIGRIYNLGSHEVVTLLDTAKVLVEARKGGAYTIKAFPKERATIDIGSFYSCYDRIKSELGWCPAVTLRDGLERTLDYFNKCLDRYL